MNFFKAAAVSVVRSVLNGLIFIIKNDGTSKDDFLADALEKLIPLLDSVDKNKGMIVTALESLGEFCVSIDDNNTGVDDKVGRGLKAAADFIEKYL